MHIALWVVQGLLALAFLAAGTMKSITPLAELAAQMHWVGAAPAFVPRLAGISEILGAIGLILPSALRIMPKLTVVAAAALAFVMLLAAVLHVSRGEYAELPPSVLLGGLAAFVAYGRARLAPITPKGA